MRNLFIMHTQYNILSALAVVQQEYSGDENDIAVIAEFDITAAYIAKLNSIFDKVIVIQDHFDRTSVWNRATVFQRKYKKAKSLLTTYYDRVITAQEQYFDTLIVTKLREKNPGLLWQSVEEDAYYTACPSSVFKDSFMKKLAKNFYYDVFLPVFYGKNLYYEIQPCYGSNTGIQTIFLTFPQVARKELGGKIKKEVCSEYLVEATRKLYSGTHKDCELKNKSVVFLSDLISRYSDGRKVFSRINELFKQYRGRGYNLYVKYHPRESTPWVFSEDVGVLSTSYPSELLLAANQGKEIVWIGNASTAIILAAKFGYKVFSILERGSDNYEIITFYRKIGIQLYQ